MADTQAVINIKCPVPFLKLTSGPCWIIMSFADNENVLFLYHKSLWAEHFDAQTCRGEQSEGDIAGPWKIRLCLGHFQQLNFYHQTEQEVVAQIVALRLEHGI